MIQHDRMMGLKPLLGMVSRDSHYSFYFQPLSFARSMRCLLVPDEVCQGSVDLLETKSTALGQIVGCNEHHVCVRVAPGCTHASSRAPEKPINDLEKYFDDASSSQRAEEARLCSLG